MATSTGIGMSGILILLVIIGLVASIGLAFIPANIAKKKGYGFGGFFVLGLFFFLIGLIVALCLDDKNAQMNQMTNAIHSINGKTSQPPSTSIGDELQKYNELLRQEAITRDEYDSLKAKLLNGSDNACPNCGATVKKDSAFCSKCGTRIS